MSSAPVRASDYPQPENEWTIMVFFAGDPHLSPSMTAQLKAIKDAGFQENASVLVHYDPNERGVATTTFDINSNRKQYLLQINETGTIIGDGKDPYIRNLTEDAIDGTNKATTADQALKSFLEIGASAKYRAKHYMLFLVGHGVIVGNDMFLPDATPQTGISLEQLGDTLRHFKRSIPEDSFELLGLHSCSMSGIEVAFELKNTAKYMMATEGASFVASWPYRQLLKKVLNAIDKTKSVEAKANNQTEIDVVCLIKSIFGLALYNSTDFMFSGLSADLCLCSLDEDLVDALKVPLEELTKALKNALEPAADWDSTKAREWRGVELIKLAHLEAQSYFQETYTDLYDFCLCLGRRCTEGQAYQKTLETACTNMMKALEKGRVEKEKPTSVIVQADHFGPLFQYSHGLSVFFPWQRPVEEEPLVLDDNILTRYEKYEFTKALGDDSWLSFLEAYFTATLRKSREEEDDPTHIAADISGIGTNGSFSGAMAIDNTDTLAKDSPSLAKDSPSLTKDSPSLSAGCTCSIKNYPRKFSLKPIATENPNREANKRAEDDRQVKWAKQADRAEQAKKESEV